MLCGPQLSGWGLPGKKVVSWTRAKVARDFKLQAVRNALIITIPGDREKAAIWRLDQNEVDGQTFRLQAIPARMRCDGLLD